MKRKYQPEVELESGWCRWIYPLHGHGKRNYRLACCDCHLVHEMQFRVVKDTQGRLSIKFRAARNNRVTAALRRKKK